MVRTWLIVLLIAVFALSACSNEASTNQKGNNKDQSSTVTDNQKAPEPVNLRVSWWGGDSRHAKWNEMLDKFEEKYSHIKVSREFSDYNGYWDKLATQAAGGNAPDVIMQVMHMFAQYAERGQLMELDELIASGKIDLSDWSQSIIDSGKLNDKTYMVSYGNTSNAVLYNETLFENSGVETPKLNWNWTDFVNKATEIQSKLPEGVWATENLGGYDSFYINWLLSRGGIGFYTPEGQLSFSKDDLTEWFALWDNLQKSGATPPPNVQAEYPNERPEQTMLAQGKVSMFVRPLNQLPAFQNGSQDKLELAMVPSDKQSGQDLGGAYASIYSKTKHPEEALLLLNFFISDMDAANIMKMEYGPMGSQGMNDTLSTSLEQAEQKGINFMTDIRDLINVPTHPPSAAGEVAKQFFLANEAVAFGQKSIEIAVNDFFNEATKILDR